MNDPMNDLILTLTNKCGDYYDDKTKTFYCVAFVDGKERVIGSYVAEIPEWIRHVASTRIWGLYFANVARIAPSLEKEEKERK